MTANDRTDRTDQERATIAAGKEAGHSAAQILASMQAQGDGKLVSFSAGRVLGDALKEVQAAGKSPREVSQMFAADQKARKDAMARYRPVRAEPVPPPVQCSYGTTMNTPDLDRCGHCGAPVSKHIAQPRWRS
jgi:uncharacterized protein YbjT (DUF2867 family)